MYFPGTMVRKFISFFKGLIFNLNFYKTSFKMMSTLFSTFSQSKSCRIARSIRV
eukprot:UN13727